MSTTRCDRLRPGGAADAEPVWAELFRESDNRDRRDRLLRNLRRATERELTPRQRQVLELYYGRQLSVTYISSLLGVAPSTVSRTLRRAEERLRHHLEYSL